MEKARWVIHNFNGWGNLFFVPGNISVHSVHYVSDKVNSALEQLILLQASRALPREKDVYSMLSSASSF